MPGDERILSDAPTRPCRACAADAVHTVLELADQPVADVLYPDVRSAREAPRHRLALATCQRCGLVQLDGGTPLLPNAEHGHGSAFSGTVLAHEHTWAEELLSSSSLPQRGRVLDVSSGGGGLLRPFAEKGLTVRGWERSAELAAQATREGIPTRHLEGTTVGDDDQYDLVIVNHTLSHTDDLDGMLGGLANSLARTGTLAVEFHHALGILTGGQFDVISHAHRSYLSLSALSAALARHGLSTIRAQSLPLHGGVVRLQARHAGQAPVVDPGVSSVLASEQAAGLDSPEAWATVADRAAGVRSALREAVALQWAAGRTVAAYGAPTRGITLLNHCGIGADQLPRTADRSPAKQGRFLPGCATAVCTPEELAAQRPDVLVVLVWPLRDEVLAQHQDLRSAGTRFLFPLPEPELVA